MTGLTAPHAQAAVQLLIWALEEIEKAHHVEAAEHARNALDALRRSDPEAQVHLFAG